MITYYVFPGLKHRQTINPNRLVAPDRIIRVVSEYFSRDITIVTSNKVEEQRPMKIAMYLLRKYTVLSYREIAMYFGNNDHSRVNYHIAGLTGLIKFDSTWRNLVNEIEMII